MPARIRSRTAAADRDRHGPADWRVGSRQPDAHARLSLYGLELRLNKDDVGEGKLLAGTKIYIDKANNLVLENYSIQPVMLGDVKKVD